MSQRAARMKSQPGASGQRVKVNEKIARELQSRIRRSELRPGDQLPPERQLAGQFGVSRGSVREALRALELSGIIVSRQGGGNFVTEAQPGGAAEPLSQFLDRQREHLLELSEARQLFEPRLAFLAAERATEADLKALGRAIEEQERGLREDDRVAVFNADRLFHQAIAEATRNQTFITLHNYLSDLVRGGPREEIENGSRRAQSPVDHHAIYDAIAEGNAPAASAAMVRHLKNVEAILLDALRRYQVAIADRPKVAESQPGPESAESGAAL